MKFLWSDDWIDNNFIEKTVPYLEDEKIAFAYSAAYIMDEDSKKIFYKLFEKNTIISSQYFCELVMLDGDVPVSPGCAIFRKIDVEKNLIIDIPNDNGLDFNKFGAGNDLLLFLLPLLKYENVAYVNSTKSYFRAHEDSFTCSNNLGLYYAWAKLYYLTIKKDEKLMEKFKTVIIASSLKNKDYKQIKKSITGNINYIFLISKIFGRFCRSVRK